MGRRLAILAIAVSVALSAVQSASAAPDYDGDGFTDNDCAPLDPAAFPGAADGPDLTFEDLNCDGVDGTAANAYFVSLAGDDSGTGSREIPLRTIQAAVDKAALTGGGRAVYVMGGTFTERVVLAPGVSIYGGYTPSGGRSAAEATTIQAPGGADEAVFASGATGVVLQLLTIEGADRSGVFGASSYAIRAISGSSLALTAVAATGGNAGAGVNGAPGGPGAQGDAGSCGGRNTTPPCTVPGFGTLGAGGSGGPGTNGGPGGAGGAGFNENGSGGTDGSGTSGGGSGAGGCSTTTAQCDRHGDAGSNATAAGAPGSHGTNAAFSAGSAGATWTTGTAATSGSPGEVGFGGGGGGGGRSGAEDCVDDSPMSGGGGGGGGEGGGGGGGGAGAGNGGGSFGLYVHQSSVVVVGGALGARTAGDGGNGGARGTAGPGGAGGEGGAGQTAGASCVELKTTGNGGDGGDGSNGGAGGGGGGGAGGPSAGLFAAGAASFVLKPTAQASGGTAGQGGLRGSSTTLRGGSGLSAATIADPEANQTVVDFDGDGITDAADDCPEASAATSNGCAGRPAKLPDADGDGVPDSADACPAAAAGALDANADGCPDIVPEVDKDRDGYPDQKGDCDDDNPAINIGAKEIVGNSVDENCDGDAAPFPRILSNVSTAGASANGRTWFTRLRSSGLPAGARFELRCRAPKRIKRACSFGKHAAVPVRNGRADALKLLPKRRRKVGLVIKRGATLEVRITAPDHIGKVVRYKILKRRFPVGRTLCLPPGQTKPSRCA